MQEPADHIVRDLIDRGRLKQDDVDAARRHAAARHIEVLDALLDLGRLSPRELAIARARIWEFPFVDLGQFDVVISNAGLLPPGMLGKVLVFPLFVVDGLMTLGIGEPVDERVVDQVRRHARLDVELAVCDARLLGVIVTRARRTGADPDDGTRRLSA